MRVCTVAIGCGLIVASAFTCTPGSSLTAELLLPECACCWPPLALLTGLMGVEGTEPAERPLLWLLPLPPCDVDATDGDAAASSALACDASMFAPLLLRCDLAAAALFHCSLHCCAAIHSTPAARTRVCLRAMR